MPIEWRCKKQQWMLEPTIDRAYVVVNNAAYPLRKVPAVDVDPARFENFVNKTSPEAMFPDVYVVDKVVNVRVKEGEVEYKVRWRGYNSKEDTLKPADNLLQHGA